MDNIRYAVVGTDNKDGQTCVLAACWPLIPALKGQYVIFSKFKRRLLPRIAAYFQNFGKVLFLARVKK